MMKRYKAPSKCEKCEGKLVKKKIGEKMLWICVICKMVYPYPCLSCQNYNVEWGACELKLVPELYTPKYEEGCSEYVKRKI